jgi:hypothetical protein
MIVPCRNGAPSSAGRHGNRPARLRMSASALGLVGAMWRTTQTAAGKSGAAHDVLERLNTASGRADNYELAAVRRFCIGG